MSNARIAYCTYCGNYIVIEPPYAVDGGHLPHECGNCHCTTFVLPRACREVIVLYAPDAETIRATGVR